MMRLHRRDEVLIITNATQHDVYMEERILAERKRIANLPEWKRQEELAKKYPDPCSSPTWYEGFPERKADFIDEMLACDPKAKRAFDEEELRYRENRV